MLSGGCIGAVSALELARPDRLNAIPHEVFRLMAEALAAFEASPLPAVSVWQTYCTNLAGNTGSGGAL